MSWQTIGNISIECLVILAGATIAAPFCLVLALPFMGGL
jgi:hypothetical protein